MSKYAAGLVFLLASSSCVLLTSSETYQCADDADCEARGGELRGSRCDPSTKVCVFAVEPAGSGGGASSSSASGSTSAGSAGGAPECTSNAECIEASGEQPFICSDARSCVALIVPGCTELIGSLEDLKAEEPLILGLITSYEDESSFSGLLTRNAIRLAVEEIQSAASGLPIGTNGQRRPVLFLSCDELGDAEAAATHLVEVAKVPAIYGPLDPQRALDVAANVTIPAGVLLVTPVGSGSLRTIEDSGLVTVLRYEGRGSGEATAHMVNAVEGPLRTDLDLSPGESLRAAFLIRNDAVGTEIGSGFDDVISLNGLDMVGNLDAGNAIRIGISLDGSDFSDVVSELLALEPHLIVGMLDGTTGSALVRQVETNWPEEVPFPQWTFDRTAKATAVGDAFAEMRELRGDIVRRPYFIMGPFLHPERDNYNDFSVRFRTRFPQLVAGTGEAPQGYDAAWALAYAAVGAGDVVDLDGGAFASGFGALQGPGASVDIGPDHVNEALSPLKAGQSIQFRPTLREFYLDESGNSAAYFVAGCTKGGESPTNYGSFGYDPQTREVSGEPNFLGLCP